MSSRRRTAADCSSHVSTKAGRELGEGTRLPDVKFHSRAAKWATKYPRKPAITYDQIPYGTRSKQIQKQYSKANAWTLTSTAIDYSFPVHEDISADTRVDDTLGNNSDSQGLMSPASTPPPILVKNLTPLDQDLRYVGLESSRLISSKEPSTVIGKSSESSHVQMALDSINSAFSPREKDTRMTSERRHEDFDSPQRELDSLSSPYSPREKDTRMTIERRHEDFDVMGSQQRRGAKVTRIVNACASCRRNHFVVITLPLLVFKFITYTSFAHSAPIHVSLLPRLTTL